MRGEKKNHSKKKVCSFWKRLRGLCGHQRTHVCERIKLFDALKLLRFDILLHSKNCKMPQTFYFSSALLCRPEYSILFESHIYRLIYNKHRSHTYIPVNHHHILLYFYLFFSSLGLKFTIWTLVCFFSLHSFENKHCRGLYRKLFKFLKLTDGKINYK